MGSVRLLQGDCLELIGDLPGGSINAVITDPPYGVGTAEWDKAVDVSPFTEEVRRVLTADGFYAFTGQMPSIALWHAAATAERFHFCEHVVWLKRLVTPGVRLSRTHESIYIYAAGGRKKFYKVKGPYEDVRLPGLCTGAYSFSSLTTYIQGLRARAEGRSDGIHNTGTGRQGNFARYELVASYCSPEMVNYSNAWSFLPPSYAKKDGRYNHPTEKPVLLMERLVEMLTPEGGVVLDPFMGSGTTGVACVQTGRNFIGMEIQEEYFRMAEHRIAEAQQALVAQPELLP